MISNDCNGNVETYASVLGMDEFYDSLMKVHTDAGHAKARAFEHKVK
jgi:hypothetical protein